MTIGQDAAIYASIIDPGKSVSLPTPDGRRVWVHVVRGSVKVNGDSLSSGDGAGAVDEDHVTIEAVKDSEVLVFEV
ncbi:MAG: hypothetical protein GC162_01785 [Planctomycetes bacterium]|nr:hypothetical protein [Planctomycetota bacterium]